MSLLAAISEWEARNCADETRAETTVKQAKQVFRGAVTSDPVMKHGNPQKTAISAACFTVSPPRARNSETGLPEDILIGLSKLRSGWEPNLIDPLPWREIALDAQRIANDEWAGCALALGWSPLDLWGHSADRDGLAIWLRGRTIRAIDAQCAIVVDHDPDQRAGFNRCRHGMPGAKLLWEIGQ